MVKFHYESLKHKRAWNPETRAWDLPMRGKTWLGWWIELNWDEWADMYKYFPYFPDSLKQAICKVWGGHSPMDDQCMKPEHRFCSWCGRATPNAEVIDG